MSLLSLKDPLLNKIISFVSNVPDFRSCALTCTRLRSLLQDDDVWKYCKGKRVLEVKSDRKRALEHDEIMDPCEQIRKHQSGQHFEDKKEELNLEWNYILRVLKLQGWRDLVTKILSSEPINYPCEGAGNKLRRPVLLTLVNLVQANMIDFLEGVNLLSLHRSSNACSKDPSLRPSVSEADVVLANRMMLHSRWYITHPEWLLGSVCLVPAQTLVGNKSRDSIVNALLRVSGIAYEEDGVIERVWVHIVALLRELLYRVAVAEEAPYGKYLNNLDARRVEEAAERAGCRHSRVYGILNAEDYGEDDYESCDETSNNDEEEDDDCATLSDAEDPSDFSVHSDKDCPTSSGRISE